MHKYLFLLYVPFLSACGQAALREPPITFNPVLQKYVEDFYIMADKYGLDIPYTNMRVIDFGNPSNYRDNNDNDDVITAGVCVEYRIDDKMRNKHKKFSNIFIDKEIFYEFSESQRKWLLFHELGHCLLYLDHSDDTCNYMFPIIPNNDKFIDNCGNKPNDIMFGE